MIKQVLLSISKIIQIPWFWLIIFSLFLICLLIYLLRWLGKNYIMRGYKLGKKITKASEYQLRSIIDNISDLDTFDENIKNISNKVFSAGFSPEIQNADEETENINSLIEKSKSEKEDRIIEIKHNYKDEREGLEKDLKEQEVLVENKRKELSQIQEKYMEKLDEMKKNHKEGEYTSEKIIDTLKKKFENISKNWSTNILRFGYFVLFLLFLLGDYLVTYKIFSDILSAQTGDNELLIYVGPGIIVLVFLMFLSFTLNSMTHRKLIRQFKKNMNITVGALLVIAYVLIVMVAVLPKSVSLIDAILRILLVPLVVVAGLMLEYMRENFGSFSFLLIIPKILIFSIGIILTYILLPIESIIRTIKNKNKFRKKVLPMEEAKRDSLQMERTRLSKIRSKLSQIDDNLRRKVLETENKYEAKEKQYLLRKREIKEKIERLRQGSTEAVFGVLKSKRSRLV